ncbi:MAG: helix-turn-helix transcriptional regulator [Streptosporangiaceae bacterium]
MIGEPTGQPGRRPGAAGQPQDGPTALRIMLGSQLRRLRETGGISREQAAEAIRATHSKISRLELGRSGFKQRDLIDLLLLYGITEERERDALLGLARQANQPGWWHQYTDVMPAWLEPYIGLESASSMIRSYEIQFVHGLLQTEAYARSVIRLGNADTPRAEIERRLSLRMRRRHLVQEATGTRIWSVLDEAALRRSPGSREEMLGQIDYLLEACELPGVVLQVIPFQAGAHPAAGGPFTILRFHQRDLPDLVYLEQLTSALYLDKPEDVSDYMSIMDQLCVMAEDITGTRRLLAEIRRSL